MVKKPPKGKLLSTLKDTCDPNDVKLFLFADCDANRNRNQNTAQTVAIESPIRHQIRQIEKKLMKRRQQPTDESQSKSQIDTSAERKRYQRMKYLGIIPPTTTINTTTTRTNVAAVEDEIEKFSMCDNAIVDDDKLTSKDGKKKLLLQDTPKLLPKIPALVSCNVNSQIEDECVQSKLVQPPPTIKVQPRGKKSRDKSMPCIEDDINATRQKLQQQQELGKVEMKVSSFEHEIERDNQVAQHNGNCDVVEENENQSEMRRKFYSIIASKRREYNENSQSPAAGEGAIVASDDTESMLSSVGTNFTYDSGSYVMIFDEKIPKSKVNMEKKFQVLSTIIVFKNLTTSTYFLLESQLDHDTSEGNARKYSILCGSVELYERNHTSNGSFSHPSNTIESEYTG
jgi:hypothetical protein